MTEQDYAARVRALTEALAMARSIALSGERWTEQAEATYRAALAAPAPSEPGHLAISLDDLREALALEFPEPEAEHVWGHLEVIAGRGTDRE